MKRSPDMIRRELESIDFASVFQDLAMQVKRRSWFTSDWRLYVNGAYMHVYKENWKNENHNGVHFETYVEEREIEKGKVPVFLHAEKDVKNKQKFVAKFLECADGMMTGYHMDTRIQRGDYVRILSSELNLSTEPDVIVEAIVKELDDLQDLAHCVDKALRETQ